MEYNFRGDSKNNCDTAKPTIRKEQVRLKIPKECTEVADNPDVIVVDRDHPNWDFRPWFKEKTNNIKEAFEGLLEYYEKDPNEFKLATNSEMTSKEFILDRIDFEIRVIKGYADAIRTMFESGRLTVRDVRLEEE